ncbi:MAG: PD-(D/E)XK nuclease family transposase [Bacteroidales bacterium]|nr:hypothetical protein [Clostridia bacterium]
MTSTSAKYINPFIDFGFRRFFGEETNKCLLLDFLNEVLRDERFFGNYSRPLK